MGSGLGYALTGAAIGLGDEIVRRAAEKRELAREILKQNIRKGERKEDREDDLFDTAAENEREDAKAERLRRERAGVRGTSRSQKLGDLADKREHTAGLLTAEQEREDAKAERRRRERAGLLTAEQEREDRLAEAERKRKAKETKRLEARKDLASREVQVIKSADSNAIARAIGTAFGGFYDPVNGTFSGMDQDLATRALSIMARAEEIWAEAKASGNPIGHRSAANQAMNEAKAAAGGGGDGSGDVDDPLGILR